ncbi:MAG: methyltransferase [Pasteurellaceae bacterium]|nr:methyltransferase [Pasteurellaceae bacterium]
MASTGFQFKQFFVAHDQCAMKVNTDGILLGAIADTHNAKQILDIGTGTGLVALMLAQRTANDVQITGLEIEPSAFQQATQNVANSPWAGRITILQGGLFEQDFVKSFELIVSNPPYFTHSLPSRNAQRDLARFLNQSHFQWLKQAKNWLSLQGKIYFILPTKCAESLIIQAESIGLYCHEKWQICTKKGKNPKRQIIGWGLIPTAKPHTHILTIYEADNQYSESFKVLTQAFYLNF